MEGQADKTSDIANYFIYSTESVHEGLQLVQPTFVLTAVF